MSAIKGWEGVVKYSNRVVLESVGTGSGGAGQDYDLGYEADDELGVVTDDPVKIEVFLDGVLQATTGIYTLDGDGGTAGVGQINLIGSHDGEVIEASYYTYQEIGYIQSVGLSSNNNVESLYEFGSRAPKEAKEGNIDISLSMTRTFIDLSLVATCAHEPSAVRGWLASELFDIDVYAKGETGGDPLMTVRGKFNNYTFDLPQDGLAMDTVDMVGETITLTTA